MAKAAARTTAKKTAGRTAAKKVTKKTTKAGASKKATKKAGAKKTTKAAAKKTTKKTTKKTGKKWSLYSNTSLLLKSVNSNTFLLSISLPFLSLYKLRRAYSLALHSALHACSLLPSLSPCVRVPCVPCVPLACVIAYEHQRSHSYVRWCFSDSLKSISRSPSIKQSAQTKTTRLDGWSWLRLTNKHGVR